MCLVCSRAHPQRVCKKVFLTKRKAFDSTKARVAGTEAAKFVGKAKGGAGGRGARGRGRGRRRGGASSRQGRRSPPVGGAGAGGKQKKWKAKSSAFRDAMRAAREYNAAKAAGMYVGATVLPRLWRCAR